MAEGCEFGFRRGVSFNSCDVSIQKRLTPMLGITARTMRIAEVLEDFRILLHRVAQCQASPLSGEEQLVGFVMLRSCHQEAQALASTGFHPPGAPGGDSPAARQRELQRYGLSKALLTHQRG